MQAVVNSTFFARCLTSVEVGVEVGVIWRGCYQTDKLYILFAGE